LNDLANKHSNAEKYLARTAGMPAEKCKKARLNQQPLFLAAWAWHPDLVYLRHRHAN
jgi:hypothetical protein